MYFVLITQVISTFERAKSQLAIQTDQTPFRAGAYNFQSISALGGKAVLPRETNQHLKYNQQKDTT